MNLDWIIAAVSPRDIAVHPNFSETEYSAPRALAARLKGWDFAIRDEETALSEVEVDDRDLVIASRTAFNDGDERATSQMTLQRLAEDASDLALATVAGLFYVVSAADDDDYEAVFRALDRSLSRCQEVADKSGAPLLLALLHLQRALRNSEVGQDSSSDAQAAAAQLASLQWSDLGDVSTSLGAGWDATRTWSRVRRELDLVAGSHLVSSEPFSNDELWKDLIRQESSPVRVEFESSGGEGLEKYVLERFNLLTKDASLRFGGGDSTEGPLVDELMHYELVGSRSAPEARKLLGQLRLLRAERHGVMDSLRLIRQSGDSKTFAKAMRHLRGSGPLAAVRAEAVAVVDRRRPQWWRRADLEALALGSDLLTTEEATRGFSKAEEHLSTVAITAEARFSMDSLMAAMAALARGCGGSDALAHRIYELVLQSPSDQLLLNAYSRGLAGLDWAVVSNETRSDWSDWLSSAPNDADRSALRLALSAAIGAPKALPEGGPSLFDIAGQMNGLLRDPSRGIASEVVDVFVEVLVAAMRSVRTEAASGTYGFGGVSPSGLAVMLVLRYPRDDLWDAIAGFVTDAGVPRDMKAEALERMSTEPEKVPSNVVLSLTRRIESLSSVSTAPMFGTSTGAFGPAVNAAAALGLRSNEALLVEVAGLISSPSAIVRNEATTALRSIARRSDALQNWSFALLIQLTHDADPSVRANAGQALAVGVLEDPESTTLARSRLQQLLSDDAVLTPLLVIRGLAERWHHAAGSDPVLVDAVRLVRETTLSALVRNASDEYLQLIDSPGPQNQE